jgi:hypothetical protein
MNQNKLLTLKNTYLLKKINFNLKKTKKLMRYFLINQNNQKNILFDRPKKLNQVHLCLF